MNTQVNHKIAQQTSHTVANICPEHAKHLSRAGRIYNTKQQNTTFQNIYSSWSKAPNSTVLILGHTLSTVLQTWMAVSKQKDNTITLYWTLFPLQSRIQRLQHAKLISAKLGNAPNQPYAPPVCNLRWGKELLIQSMPAVTSFCALEALHLTWWVVRWMSHVTCIEVDKRVFTGWSSAVLDKM